MPSYQILIASYAKDFPFLEHCLWSLQRFSHDFLPPVVVVSSVDYESAKGLASRHFPQAAVKIRDGHAEFPFMRAQLSMLEADRFCAGDYVWLVGSDCFAHRHFTPEDYLAGGRPVMPYNSYEYLRDRGNNAVCWQGGTGRILGSVPEHEFMRVIPLVYPRELFSGLRWYVEMVHGECFDGVINREWKHNKGVSESNLLGAFAWTHRHNDFEWINLDAQDSAGEELHNPMLQFWSHGGLDCKSNRHSPYVCGDTFGKPFSEIVTDVRQAVDLAELEALAETGKTSYEHAN